MAELDDMLATLRQYVGEAPTPAAATPPAPAATPPAPAPDVSIDKLLADAQDDLASPPAYMNWVADRAVQRRATGQAFDFNAEAGYTDQQFPGLRQHGFKVSDKLRRPYDPAIVTKIEQLSRLAAYMVDETGKPGALGIPTDKSYILMTVPAQDRPVVLELTRRYGAETKRDMREVTLAMLPALAMENFDRGFADMATEFRGLGTFFGGTGKAIGKALIVNAASAIPGGVGLPGGQLLANRYTPTAEEDINLELQRRQAREIYEEAQPAIGGNFLTRGFLGAARQLPTWFTSLAIERAAGGMAAPASTAFWFTMTAPGSYARLRGKGVDHPKSVLLATFSGLAQALIERQQVSQALQPKELASWKRFVANLVGTTIGEIGEEGAQEAIQDIAEQIGVGWMGGNPRALLPEHVRQIWETTKQAAEIMPWLVGAGAPGTALNVKTRLDFVKDVSNPTVITGVIGADPALYRQASIMAAKPKLTQADVERLAGDQNLPFDLTPAELAGAHRSLGEAVANVERFGKGISDTQRELNANWRAHYVKVHDQMDRIQARAAEAGVSLAGVTTLDEAKVKIRDAEAQAAHADAQMRAALASGERALVEANAADRDMAQEDAQRQAAEADAEFAEVHLTYRRNLDALLLVEATTRLAAQDKAERRAALEADIADTMRKREELYARFPELQAIDDEARSILAEIDGIQPTDDPAPAVAPVAVAGPVAPPIPTPSVPTAPAVAVPAVEAVSPPVETPAVGEPTPTPTGEVTNAEGVREGAVEGGEEARLREEADREVRVRDHAEAGLEAQAGAVAAGVTVTPAPMTEAGLRDWGSRVGKRVRFNRGNMDDTMRAAILTQGNKDRYVYATANGYVISETAPPPGQNYVRLSGTERGRVERVEVKLPASGQPPQVPPATQAGAPSPVPPIGSTVAWIDPKTGKAIQATVEEHGSVEAPDRLVVRVTGVEKTRGASYKVGDRVSQLAGNVQVTVPAPPAAQAGPARFAQQGPAPETLYHGSVSPVVGQPKLGRTKEDIQTKFGRLKVVGSVFEGFFLAKTPEYASTYSALDPSKVVPYHLASDAKVLRLPGIISEEVLTSRGWGRDSKITSLPQPTAPFPFQAEFESYAFERMNRERIAKGKVAFSRQRFAERTGDEWNPVKPGYDAEELASKYLADFIKEQGYDAVEMGREVVVLNTGVLQKGKATPLAGPARFAEGQAATAPPLGTLLVRTPIRPNSPGETTKLQDSIGPLIPGGRAMRPIGQRELHTAIRKIANVAMFRAATGNTGILGLYLARARAAIVAIPNDVRTAIHEGGGHGVMAMLDVFGEHAADPTFDAELAPFAQLGSEPPATFPDPALYRRLEGAAEWMVAYMSDPEATAHRAPAFTAAVKAKAAAVTGLWERLEHAGRMWRHWNAQLDIDKEMGQIDLDPIAKQPGLLAKLGRWIEAGGGLQERMIRSITPEALAGYVRTAHRLWALGETQWGDRVAYHTEILAQSAGLTPTEFAGLPQHRVFEILAHRAMHGTTVADQQFLTPTHANLRPYLDPTTGKPIGIGYTIAALFDYLGNLSDAETDAHSLRAWAYGIAQRVAGRQGVALMTAALDETLRGELGELEQQAKVDHRAIEAEALAPAHPQGAASKEVTAARQALDAGATRIANKLAAMRDGWAANLASARMELNGLAVELRQKADTIALDTQAALDKLRGDLASLRKVAASAVEFAVVEDKMKAVETEAQKLLDEAHAARARQERRLAGNIKRLETQTDKMAPIVDRLTAAMSAAKPTATARQIAAAQGTLRKEYAARRAALTAALAGIKASGVGLGEKGGAFGLSNQALTPTEVSQAELDQSRKAIAQVEAAGLGPAYNEFLRRNRLQWHALLDRMVEGNRLTRETADRIRDSDDFYVPMQRLQEVELGMGKRGGMTGAVDLEAELQDVLDGRSARARQTRGEALGFLKPFKGSTATIKDPRTALYRATAAAMRGILTNDAKLAFLAGFRGGEDPDIATPLPTESGNNLVVYRGGEKEYWRVARVVVDLDTALMGTRSWWNLNWFTRLFPVIPNVLKTGVVTNPLFLVTNWTRDTLTRPMVSTAPMNWDNIAFRRSSLTDEQIRAAGGLMSGWYLNDPTAHAAALRAITRELRGDKGTVILGPRGLADWYLNLGRKSEAMGRRREARNQYNTMVSAGIAPDIATLIAVYESNDIQDFAVSGAVVGDILNPIIPFLNPQVQGLRRQVRTWRQVGAKLEAGDVRGAAKQATRQALRYALFGVMVDLMCYTLNCYFGNKRRYENESPLIKDLFFTFYLGAGGQRILIPRGFAGAISTGLARRSMEYANGNQDAFSGTVGNLLWQQLPGSGISTLAGPFAAELGVAANRDLFWGTYLVPPYEEGRLPRQTKSWDRASLLGRGLSRGIEAATPWTLHPAKIDYLLRQHFGYWGSTATKASALFESERPVGLTKDIIGQQLVRNMADYPLYRSDDVQWLMGTAKEQGWTNKDEFKQLMEAVFEYANLPQSTDREKYLNNILTAAQDIRDRWGRHIAAVAEVGK